MPFDLSTAKPVEESSKGGFDLSTAKPVDGSDLSEQIPGNKKRKIEPTKPSTLTDKALGLGEAGLSAVSSLAAPMAAAGQYVAGGLTSALGLTDASKKRGEEQYADLIQKYTYEPTTEKGKEYLSRFGEMLESAKVPIWPVTSGLPGAGAGAAALRSGAGKLARGIAESPEADLLRAGASKAKAAITPNIDTDRAALARKAQSIGIDIRPDMLTDNRFARIIGQALEDIPLSGSKVDQRQQAFNRAIIGTIGGDESATRLTPDVFEKAMDKSGGTIGSLYAKTPVPLDDALQGDLTKHLMNTSKETEDVSKVVQSYVTELRNAAENGVIPGTALRKINTEMGAQIRSTPSGDLRRALGNLKDDLDEALSRNVSAEELESLQEARKQYAIGIRLIPMVAKSPVGNMSPAGLMQAVTSDKSGKRAMAFGRGGDIGELAKIGQLFLKEPRSSYTTERGLVYGGLLGGGAYVEPHTAVGVYGAANLYNRAGPAIARKMTGFKPEDKFGAAVRTAQPEGAAPLPEVPGAAPVLPGTNLSSLLGQEEIPRAPLPQFPEALQSSLERQLGVPGSSISLGQPPSGRTPLPAMPPQESGLLSTVGAPLAGKESQAMNAIEMKLRPEVIDRVAELRKIYSDDEKYGLFDRTKAALELGKLEGTYPGFVADMLNADSTFKMLYESGKGTALPIEKTGRSGPVTYPGKPGPKPKAPPAISPQPSAPSGPTPLPNVEGAAPILPGSNLSTLLQPEATPNIPLPELPPSISSLREMLKQTEEKPASAASAQMPISTEFNAPSLLQVIRQKGGADIKEIRDITGEARVGAGRKGLPPNTFVKEGKTLGDLATALREEGWAIPDDVDGGVQALRDMIREELDGKKQYSIADTDRLTMWEYNERLREEGESALTVAEQDKMLEMADKAPPIMLDDWENFTEAEKNAELDKLFGADTRPESKGPKGR